MLTKSDLQSSSITFVPWHINRIHLREIYRFGGQIQLILLGSLPKLIFLKYFHMGISERIAFHFFDFSITYYICVIKIATILKKCILELYLFKLRTELMANKIPATLKMMTQD